MAINTQKLLPIAKSSTAIVKHAGSQISNEKKFKGGSLIKSKKAGIQKKESDKGELVKQEQTEKYKPVISKLISIDKFLKANSENQKKLLEKETLEKKEKSSKEREKKLETKSKPKGINLPSISLPKFDFLESVKRYFLFTFLGWLFTNTQQFLPQLLKILDIIKPVVAVAEFIFKGLLEGFITFIDLGYKAYDTVRGVVKNLGGEGAQKTFDDLSKNLNTLITTTILVAGAIVTLGEKTKKPEGPSGPKGPQPSGGPRRSPITGRPVPTTSGGRTAGRPDIRNPLREQPRITGSGGGRAGRPDVRNPLRQRPTVTTGGGKPAPRLPGGRPVPRLPAGSVRGVPVIGPLIDFGIRTLIFKESPGRAAAGAIGAGIGQALGGALVGTIGGIVGSVVPFAGTLLGGSAGAFVGQLIGGFVGDWIGTSLYDAIVSMRDKKKIEKKESGGKVSPRSRSKKPRRTIKVAPRRPSKRKPSPTQPGKNVGGEKKVIELYSKEKGSSKTGILKRLLMIGDKEYDTTTFTTLVKNSTTLKEIPLVGRFLGAGLDAGALGQAPDKNLTKGFAQELNYFVQLQTQQQVSQSLSNIRQAISAMADGGTVPQRSIDLSNQNDITSEIEKSLSGLIDQRINESIKNLSGVLKHHATGRQEMLEENLRRARGGGGGRADEGVGGGMLPGNAPPEIKAMLDAIAGAEGGWDSVNPSTSVKGLSNMTIAEARLAAIRKGIGEKGGSGAMGKFQQMPDHILEKARDAGLDPYKDKFNEENQTKIARMLMASVYPGGEAQLIKDLKNDPMKASRYLRGTWPSLPGGTQENVHTRGFLNRYNRSLDVYQSTSNVPKGESKVSSDIQAFREFRNRQFGATKERKPTGTGEYYQIRELGIYGSKSYEISPLADDTSYEIGEHKGAGHKENRAFDIPVPDNSAEGDRVAKFWEDRGYTVLWKVSGHYNHVHVEVPAHKAKEFFKVMKEEDKKETEGKGREYDVIIPLDHHSGRVPDKSLWPNASLGASGRERSAQDPTAQIIKARLEAKGLRVKVMRPEDYRTESEYNKDLIRYSQSGSVVSSIHYDAPRSQSGIGFLARLGASPDKNDREYANKLAPILQRMAREAGGDQGYGGIDTAGNITMRMSGPATAALIELGALVEQERKYGKEFWKNPAFLKHLNEVADATASSVQKRSTEQRQRPLGQQATLNNKPVIWNGTRWVPRTTQTERNIQQLRLQQSEQTLRRLIREQENEAKFAAERPWWDKFGFFGGAAAERKRQEQQRRQQQQRVQRRIGGGPIGDSISKFAPYENYGQAASLAILPIETQVMVPVPMKSGGPMMFPSSNLNTKDSYNPHSLSR